MESGEGEKERRTRCSGRARLRKGGKPAQVVDPLGRQMREAGRNRRKHGRSGEIKASPSGTTVKGCQ